MHYGCTNEHYMLWKERGEQYADCHPKHQRPERKPKAAFGIDQPVYTPGAVNHRAVEPGARPMREMTTIEMYIAMNVGTALQNDVATVQINIPIDISRN